MRGKKEPETGVHAKKLPIPARSPARVPEAKAVAGGASTRKRGRAAAVGPSTRKKAVAAAGTAATHRKAPATARGSAVKQERAAWFHDRLIQAYPDARCTLDFKNPLELYVATVLSAQCTDVRVNQVTPELFSECRRPEDYLSLGQSGLEKRIRSTGFFRNKARSIVGACAALITRFDGEIPSTMEDLLTLPGVGRKTANVILGNSFSKQEGIVVDTHVARVTQRLGLTSQKDPVRIEQDLMPLFPRDQWTVLAHRLILHGRGVCSARAPRCGACTLAEKCPSAMRATPPASPRPSRPKPAPR